MDIVSKERLGETHDLIPESLRSKAARALCALPNSYLEDSQSCSKGAFLVEAEHAILFPYQDQKKIN